MQLVGLLVQDVGDRAELLLPVVVGDLEHRALGPLDELACRRLAREDARLDLVRRRQQRPHLGVVADDPAVLARVAGRGDPAGELVDRLRAPDLLQLAVLAERLGDRQVVDLAVALVELEHRREHRAVLLAVEVLGPQVLLDEQRMQMALVEQHRPEHRLLGLEVVGRNGDVLDGAHLVPEHRSGTGGRNTMFPLAAPKRFRPVLTSSDGPLRRVPVRPPEGRCRPTDALRRGAALGPATRGGAAADLSRTHAGLGSTQPARPAAARRTRAAPPSCA